MRRLLPLLFVVCGLAVPTAAHAASVNVIAAIGDQHPTMFSDPQYLKLHLHRTRYFIRWDAIDSKTTLASTDAYVKAAKAAGVKVLMHIATNDFEPKQAKLPSVASYRKKVGALIKRYKKMGVTDWGAWNEANHKTEPTWNNPTRAAQFYLAMKSMCTGCTIVALDVLDQAGANNWTLRWFKALPASEKTHKMIIGIHDYTDANSFRSTGTSSIITAALKRNARAKFWFTETGGLACLQAIGSKKATYPYSLSRQAKAVTQAFSLAKQFDSVVERIYTFNWNGLTNPPPPTPKCPGFDAGLVNLNDTPRPALTSFVKALKSFKR